MKDFGHYLKIRYGLPPEEPTEAQLSAIIRDISDFARTKGREPDDAETGRIVKRHCPRAGSYKYAADVNAELRRQIAQVAQAAQAQRK